MLAEGNTVKKVAAILGVSGKTVEAHKFNLMRKLDIHNKAATGNGGNTERRSFHCPSRQRNVSVQDRRLISRRIQDCRG